MKKIIQNIGIAMLIGLSIGIFMRIAIKPVFDLGRLEIVIIAMISAVIASTIYPIVKTRKK